MTGRSRSHVLQERAASVVSGVVMILEDALDRARQAHEQVRNEGYDGNSELALSDVIKGLQRLRRRFEQATIYAGPQQRLL